ncbi:MAG: M4 family metallopeptidase [Acidobacteriota bacterium]|nr:M4 family metallopeptidase [Acidobacteriota bacterium]
MKKLLTAVILMTASAAFGQFNQDEGNTRMERTSVSGGSEFIQGRLGRLGTGRVDVAAKNFLEQKKHLLGAEGSETFEPVGEFVDELGQTHVRLQQRMNNLPVFGAEYIVHADADRNVFAMNGRFTPNRGLPREASVDGWSAIQRAAEQAGIANGSYDAWPTLTYVVNERGNAFLAWRVTVAYTGVDGEEVDHIFADATSGDLVLRAPQIHRARNRNTYNGNSGSALPGTLVLTETGGSTSDSAISTAHAHAATSYDYYSSVHSRDSYNNAGAQIKTTVHHKVAYNNAFWNGSQLVYGDGDGTQFSMLGNALDVGAHELTHAVTTYSANLTYANESGALNEGTSDIMAAAAEAWKDGSVSSDTWKVGEDITTPGTSGDALRYMANPTQDGSSKDYYPTRYTGTGDNGGVHLNSGIANLAFKLMVTGGTHPRGVTTTNVTALNATAMTSINMGAKIWYRALTVYMSSSTNFAAARTATMNAATDLYGAAASATVGQAWEAVGVGGAPPPPATVVLSNGVALTGQSASTGTWKHYKITVPASQTSLAIVMSGGTGDGDLYVKRGSQPTTTSYDYRPYLSGNNETVNVTNPLSGDWFISIRAYSTFSGVSIKATYAGGGGGGCTAASGTLSGTGANSYQPSSSGYVSSVSGAHTAALTGPAGTDFDLYLQKWNGSTWAQVASSLGSTSTESINYSGTSGTYRWRIYSYTGSGTYNICTTKP